MLWLLEPALFLLLFQRNSTIALIRTPTWFGGTARGRPELKRSHFLLVILTFLRVYSMIDFMIGASNLFKSFLSLVKMRIQIVLFSLKQNFIIDRTLLIVTLVFTTERKTMLPWVLIAGVDGHSIETIHVQICWFWFLSPALTFQHKNPL